MWDISMIHWLLDWLIAWLIAWLIDWLLDWLTEGLAEWCESTQYVCVCVCINIPELKYKDKYRHFGLLTSKRCATFTYSGQNAQFRKLDLFASSCERVESHYLATFDTKNYSEMLDNICLKYSQVYKHRIWFCQAAMRKFTIHANLKNLHLN
jgi:hypothetical protein